MAYIIKVTIENTHPPVWRRIMLPENISFQDLHEVIQTAFGRDGYHLHDFSFPIRNIEIPAKGEECYGDSADEDETAIDDFLPYCKWIRYTYDFGDNCCHKIVLEKRDADYMERHAVVLKAKGDNFMEDSGGIWGDDEDNRVPFSIDEVNTKLEKWKIPKMKSGKQGRQLSEELRLGEKLKKHEKEFRKNIRKNLETYMSDVAEYQKRMEDKLIAYANEEAVRECSKELQPVSERVNSLLMTYSMIELEALKEQYIRIFRQEISDRDLRQCIYWHMFSLNDVQIVSTENETCYVALPQVDVETVVQEMRDYEVKIPYRQFQKKQLISQSGGYVKRYPVWETFEEYFKELYELSEEEIEFWSEREYGLIQNGGSATEVLMDMEENFEIAHIAARTEFWALLTEVCLNTPIPALRGYSRLEYFKLTGTEPWKLGLYKPDYIDEQSKQAGLYGIPSEQQYELYHITTKEKNNASDLRKVKKIVNEIPHEIPDLKCLLAITYLKNDRLDKAEGLLRDLYRETKDESIQEMLEMISEVKQEVAAGYGEMDFWDMDEPMENVIPFQRDKEKIGRNAPCPCGSGKKFKHCCLGKGIYD